MTWGPSGYTPRFQNYKQVQDIPFMKTRSTRSLHLLLFKIRFFCDYADQIGQLEKALARKPEKLQLDIIGSGELSPDTTF